MGIVIPIALTALSYGLGPLLLLAFRRSRISQKKLKQFHIIYTVVVSLTFTFLTALIEEQSSVAPAFFWGYIFYRINKSQFQNRGMLIPTLHDGSTAGGGIIPKSQEKPESLDEPKPQEEPEPKPQEEPEPKPQEEPEPEPVVLTYESNFKLPVKSEEIVETQQPSKKILKNKAICLLLAVVCAASLAGNAVQGYQMAKWQSNYQTEVDNLKKDLKKQRELVSKMKETRSKLRQENKDLKERNEDLTEERFQFSREFYFFATSIGFIVDGSKYYHNYNCPVFKAADTFWAHNFEYCKFLGYPQCPICNGEDGDLELAPDQTDKPVFKKVS